MESEGSMPHLNIHNGNHNFRLKANLPCKHDLEVLKDAMTSCNVSSAILAAADRTVWLCIYIALLF